jgi:hypothetical protein
MRVSQAAAAGVQQLAVKVNLQKMNGLEGNRLRYRAMQRCISAAWVCCSGTYRYSVTCTYRKMSQILYRQVTKQHENF